jgi:hypothetical protein
MQESVLAGCIPIVPENLSYTELYPSIFKYGPACFINGNVEEKLRYIIRNIDSKRLIRERNKLEETFITNGSTAIEKMVMELVKV